MEKGEQGLASSKVVTYIPKIPRRTLSGNDIRRMRVPRRHKKASYKKISDGEHKVYIRNYLNKIVEAVIEGHSLVLCGENDVGKTAAAIVIMKEARRYGYNGLFIRAYDYQQACFEKEMYDPETTIAKRARDVDVLLLDDLGKEASHPNSTGVTERTIEAVIRERMEEKKVTIITTNMDTKEQLEERYETSFVRAMKGTFAIIKIDGPSHRDQEKENIKKFIGSEGDSEMRFV